MKEISVMYLLVNKPLMLLSVEKVWLGNPVSLLTHIELFPSYASLNFLQMLK